MTSPDKLIQKCDQALEHYLDRLLRDDYYDVVKGVAQSEVPVPVAPVIESLRRIRKDLTGVSPQISVKVTRRPLLDQIKESANG